jgi:hypothetical protein
MSNCHAAKQSYMGFNSSVDRSAWGAPPVEDPGERVGQVAAELAVSQVLHRPDAPVCVRLVHVLGRPSGSPTPCNE